MKTVCIYHSIDLDGWMSASIVKHWFITNFAKGHSYVINNIRRDNGTNPNNAPELTLIGYNYGQPIPDLSEYDKVIMCDISFPLKDMLELSDKLMDTNTLNTNFIWLDHHISAINSCYIVEADGIRNTKFAACELTWQYFFPNEPMPEIVRLLGRYDCFGHKGTDEEQKVLEFQYGARSVISNYEEAYGKLKQILFDTLNGIDINNYRATINDIHRQGKAIYSFLCTEAKQVYKNGFEFHFYWAKDIGRLNNIPEQCHAKFICINKERFNPINFGINYHADGYDGAACFHYDGVAKLWRFSLYNDNGEVDCSAIAKQYGGGGHKGAAGFVVKNINEIIK